MSRATPKPLFKRKPDFRQIARLRRDAHQQKRLNERRFFDMVRRQMHNAIIEAMRKKHNEEQENQEDDE